MLRGLVVLLFVPTSATHAAVKITAGELVLVCSRYDLGAIRSVRRFKGGSRQAPKVLIESDQGLFLLKRRAPHPSTSAPVGSPALAGDEQFSERVALCHEVQLFLGSRGFPVARLVRTRGTNNSMLELNGFIYEVFGFVRGVRYDRTPPAAAESGRQLARLHQHLRELVPKWTPPPSTTFHAHPAAVRTINELPKRLNDPSVSGPVSLLSAAYERACDRAEALGVGARPTQLIHGDWHPGNLLYTEGAVPPTVAAVLDFDSMRIGAPILDLANAAFQFSVLRRADDGPGEAGSAMASLPHQPTPRISINAEAFRAFYAGYRSVERGRILDEELAVIPWLMIEAMVVETVAPIAATGRFGKLGAAQALAMTAQAIDWVGAEAERLVSLAASP